MLNSADRMSFIIEYISAYEEKISHCTKKVYHQYQAPYTKILKNIILIRL